MKNYFQAGRLLLLLLLFIGTVAQAQNKPISGTVKDAQGDPVPGANVYLKDNPSVGTVTNASGNFTLEAPNGAVVIVSAVGMDEQEFVVGAQSNYTVALTGIELETVVVNALGFETDKDKSAISSSTVDGAATVQSGETSVLTGLAGKASGVLIQRSTGDPGAGAYIQIRGQSTITGSIQPLIVLDGVPIYNSNVGASLADNNQVDGVAQQSRLNDINPDDIESIEVLKGASAAALWGTRAANGVLVITTKQGKRNGKINVNFRSTFSIDEINIKPNLQSTYGQGVGGEYAFGEIGSWGDRIASRSGEADVFDTDGARFVSDNSGETFYPITTKNSQETFLDENLDDIYQTGYFWDNSLSISGGNADGTFFLSLSDLDQQGIIRNNSDYRRTTLRFNSTKQLNDVIGFKTFTTYTRTTSNRIQQGSNISGLNLGLFRTPPDFNNEDYIGTYFSGPNALPEFGRHRSYRNPIGATETPRYNNPNFVVNENRNTTTVNRVIATVEGNAKPLDFLEFIVRAGVDYYGDRRLTFFPQFDASNLGGSTQEQNLSETQFNLDVMTRLNHQFSENFAGSILLGFNFNNRRLDNLSFTIQDFIIPSAPDNSANATAENADPFDEESIIRTNAGYTSIDLEFYNQLFVNLTGRAEAASTFGSNANSVFFYPAASVAWQFTQLDALQDNSILSFGKLRAGFGIVGIQPVPYATNTDFVNGAFAESWGPTLDAGFYGGSFIQDNIEGNDELRPERKTEVEGGLDLRFIDNRLRVSGTYYYNQTVDALFNVATAASTGFTARYDNAATIENRGVELDLAYDVVRTDNFTWSLEGNWNRNRNEVTDLAGAESILLNGFTGTSSRAVEGQPLGVLWGGLYARDEAGELILDANGFPTQALEEGVLGDPNPDWRGAIGTRFTYKGFSLYALFDHIQGGDVWAGTEGALNFFGTWDYTANQSEAPVNLVNASGNFIPANTPFRGNIVDFGGGPVALDEAWYAGGVGGGFGSVSEPFIYDATNTRLRELTLSYRLVSEGFTRVTKLASLELSVTGRNLVVWAPNVEGFDPDTNLTGPSNGRGLHYFQNPNTRSYLFTIRLTY